MFKLFTFIALASFISKPIFASPTTLTATGKVTYVGALQNGNTVVTPSGPIKVGDTYTVSATFDLSQAEVSPLYDADPTINVYDLPGTTVTYTIGSYSRAFIPLYNFDASVQLWNDHLSGGLPVDTQSFSFFDYNVTPISLLPFDLGTGLQLASLTLDAFDFTATARTNDLISQFAPLSAFNSTSFDFGQLNSDTNLFVSVQGDIESEAFSAVPEPATWGIMMLGMSAVIFVRCYRPKITTCAT